MASFLTTVLFSSLFLLTASPSPKLNAQDADKKETAKPGNHSQPSCKYCPNPDFPKEARNAKIQSASVLLEVTVTEEGAAKDVSVLRDPGNGFRDKAVEAVKKWKFRPAEDKDGNPVACKVNVEVSFRSPD